MAELEIQGKKLVQAVERKVLHSLREDGLASSGDRLVVAVSGGPDSLCLLYALHRLREAFPLQLHVAHLDHGLRSASAQDALFVAEQAKQLGLPFVAEKGNVRGFRRELGGTLEEAAREVRYAFLARVVQEMGARAVAVGHTSDDQMETLLMHLLRGTGLAGLRGMLPRTCWRSRRTGASVAVIRPLLGLSRLEIEGYCHALALEPRRDASNLSPRFLRNRVRAQLIPALKKYNPALERALLHTARSATVELVYWEEEVRRFWPQMVREEGPALVLDKKAISGLHPALQRHLLLAAAELKLGGHHYSAIEAMVSALEKPVGTRVLLPGGISFTVDYDSYRLGLEPSPPLPSLESETKVSVPGDVQVGGWRLRSCILAAPLPELPGLGWRACLNLEAVGTELSLRCRRPGDVFQPLGMEQPKRLQDFLVDAQVPRLWRERLPLLCSRGRIAWVAGWRIAHWARVTPETRAILQLELEGQPELEKASNAAGSDLGAKI
ncbi:MAG: tRNA lysidine(34) synthetase TilS [Chloroflexi bacterium]|nr:tRNA lysidine(34) synthetase TilS [Chloroflexota bacterium]